MQESKGFIGTFCLPGEAPYAILSHLINDDALLKGRTRRMKAAKQNRWQIFNDCPPQLLVVPRFSEHLCLGFIALY